MNIAETRTFQVGPYTVRQQPRFDSPSWAQYLVFLGDVLVGKSFSMPDLGCCEWLERQKRDESIYAYSSAKLSNVTGLKRLQRMLRREKPSRA